MFLKFAMLVGLLGLASCSLVERKNGQRKQLKPTEEFQHNAVLDENELFHIFWNFNETHITFEMHVQNTGWIGLGFSPSGSMVNADIVVGWVKDGLTKVTDRHGPPDSNSFPALDDQQNIELLYGEECDGWTVIKFRRQLAACEADQDMEITADTMRLIYAYGDKDPSADDITGSDYHGPTYRGTKSILLLNPSGSNFNFPENEIHASFDILNENLTVPAVDTYYNCRLFELPKFDTKQHLVKVEPIIQPGHELIVHHILIFQCTRNVTDSEAIGTDSECYTANMPDDLNSCIFVIQAWAIGGGAFYYPPHVGFELGTDDAPKYVVMQTHYDNPTIKSDIVDSSGLRFTYTPNLRQYDAGVMEVGHVVTPYQQIIPPNIQSFVDSGECSESCFSRAMQQEKRQDINLFAVVLHTHVLGRALKLKHVRKGKELAPIAQDNSYDFNFQEVRHLPEERKIIKGDALQMNCNYGSTGRTKLTPGGLGTTEEMCLSYVFYYPKVQLTFCETAPQYNALMNYLGFDEVEEIDPDLGFYANPYNLRVLAPEEYANQTVGDILDKREWNEETADQFAEDLRNMTKIQNCAGTNGLIPVNPITDPLVINEEYMEETLNCTEPSQGMPTSGTASTCQANSTSAQTATPVVITTSSPIVIITREDKATAPAVTTTSSGGRNRFSFLDSCLALLISALVCV